MEANGSKRQTQCEKHEEMALPEKKRQGKPQDPETSMFQIIKISNKGNQTRREEK